MYSFGFVIVLRVLGIHFWCQIDCEGRNLKRNKKIVRGKKCFVNTGWCRGTATDLGVRQTWVGSPVLSLMSYVTLDSHLFTYSAEICWSSGVYQTWFWVPEAHRWTSQAWEFALSPRQGFCTEEKQQGRWRWVFLRKYTEHFKRGGLKKANIR